MHGDVNESRNDGCRRRGEGPQPFDQTHQRPPAEYAILVKPGHRLRHPGCSFFVMDHRSPILRIGTVCALVVFVTACDKLGLGSSSPTAPNAPTPGSTIVYTAVGASDVTGVGSS